MLLRHQVGLLLLVLLAVVSAYPTGAPEDRCDSMEPGHQKTPKTTKAPYRVICKRLKEGKEVKGTVTDLIVAFNLHAYWIGLNLNQYRDLEEKLSGR